MNKYRIEQKIKTLSKLEIGLHENGIPEMKIDDYKFRHWDFDKTNGWRGDAWLVEKTMKAENSKKAIRKFGINLDEIILRMGFISQCYMSFYTEPLLIHKLTNNEKEIFFYKHTSECDPTGLQFNRKHFESYKKLKNFSHIDTFRFLQKCKHVTYDIPRLQLMFSALEAMCNKVEKERKCSKCGEVGKPYKTYNREDMKNILGGNLYDELYGKDGIRHKLSHGNIPNKVFDQNLVQEVYKKIVQYFNRELNTEIDEGVVKPMRHFDDNYEYPRSLFKPKDDFKISLKNCISEYSDYNIKGCKRVNSIRNLSSY